MNRPKLKDVPNYKRLEKLLRSYPQHKALMRLKRHIHDDNHLKADDEFRRSREIITLIEDILSDLDSNEKRIIKTAYLDPRSRYWTQKRLARECGFSERALRYRRAKILKKLSKLCRFRHSMSVIMEIE